jgi:hypothetical protein
MLRVIMMCILLLSVALRQFTLFSVSSTISCVQQKYFSTLKWSIFHKWGQQIDYNKYSDHSGNYN